MESNPVTPVVEIGSESAQSGPEVIYLLTRLLAGQCDGASAKDDMGFNAFHATMGNRLAAMPFQNWSERNVWQARRMLVTYKNTQLRDWWHLVPEVEEPPREGYYGRARDTTSATRETATTRSMNVVLPGEQGYDASFGGNGFFTLQQDYDSFLVDGIRYLEGRRWDAAGQRWLVPVNETSMQQVVDFAIDNGYVIPEDAASKILGRVADQERSLSASFAAQTDYEIPGLPENLIPYPFQTAGVEYAASRHNVLIGDEMGLGKTIQALLTVHVTGDFPLVVICPASLKRNWLRETQKWLPGKRVAILDSKNAFMPVNGDLTPTHDVIIINYDVVEKFMVNLIVFNPKTIVCDEAHMMKSLKTKRTKAVQSLFTSLPTARRIFLTGTPVVNREMEFFSIIKLLGYADEFGGESGFKRRYGYSTKFTREELNRRARSLFFIRRTKREVLKDLPDKAYAEVDLEMSNRSEYKRAERNLAAFLATKVSTETKVDTVQLMIDGIMQGMHIDTLKRHIEEQTNAAKQAAYAQKYDIVSRNEQLMRWEPLKQLCVEGKFESAIEWIEEFLQSGEKLVLFVWHVEIGKRIARHFRCDFLYGGASEPLRQPMVDKFQNDDATRLIVGNIQAMGVGYTLTAASNVAFLEYGWNPMHHRQAEDRCHRIGQKSAVTSWYLRATETIEDDIISLISGKEMIVDEMTEGAGVDAQALMMEHLSQRLRERIGAPA